MSAVLQRQEDREQMYFRLKSTAMINPNHEWLSCMIASWCVGQGVLPDYLGLALEQFSALKTDFFPECYIPELASSVSQLDYNRMLEKDDLVKLLKKFSKADTNETDWIIAIVVAGCLGSDHLWQDLGLWSRSQLTDLLRYNFPMLAEKNNKDMKWKKFLYKQLCETEGLYLCRAPSCEVCIDYSKCFGSEE
ncbi:MAG: nitrogen fixation protein NifQ [Methylococcales bacterium]|nr:MAG: nitrogen fixation protein NifQ [Methylococcales bacterium]